MRLLVLPRYARKGPSSRLRQYQFADALTQSGFEVDIEPFLPDEYLDALYLGRGWPIWRTLTAFMRRLRIIAGAGKYDLLWIEKEIFPFLPALTERILDWRGVRYAVDYDDAWHLRYQHHPLALLRRILSGKVDVVMRHATLVTAGNPYLVEIARQSGARRVEEVPTVVDLARYRPAVARSRRPVQIVWIGSSLNTRYLLPIVNSLASVCSGGAAELVVVGGRPLELPDVPVRFEAWSEAEETEILAASDIGIMPLADSEWDRGKCAFKIIQYMAAGLPVVASPVGVNCSLVKDDTGFLATSPSEWTAALARLVGDVELRARMGRAGRARVERDFSIASWGPRVAHLLAEAAARARE
jgi:glycosyltransferase involved in cell wall biosynthesis